MPAQETIVGILNLLIKSSTWDTAPDSLIPFPSQNNGLFEVFNSSTISLIFISNSTSLSKSKFLIFEAFSIIDSTYILAA